MVYCRCLYRLLLRRSCELFRLTTTIDRAEKTDLLTFPVIFCFFANLDDFGSFSQFIVPDIITSTVFRGRRGDAPHVLIMAEANLDSYFGGGDKEAEDRENIFL